MATLEELSQALIEADKAGNAEDAAVLAHAYSQRKAEASRPVGLQDTGQGRASSFFSNVGRGAASIVPNTIGGLGEIVGSDTLTETADTIEGSIYEALPVNPLYQDEFIQKAGNVIGQAGTTMATGGFGAGFGKLVGGARGLNIGGQIGALAPATLSGVREGAGRADELGLTGGSRYARALLGGLNELVTEKVGGLGTELGLTAKMLGESVEFGGKQIIKGTLTEAGEESGSQLLSNIEDKLMAPEGVKTPGVLKGTGEAAALGAVGGAFMGSVNSAINTIAGNPPPKTEEQVSVEGDEIELTESVSDLTREQAEEIDRKNLIQDAAVVADASPELPATAQVLNEILAEESTETTESVSTEETPAEVAESPVVETQEVVQEEVIPEAAQVQDEFVTTDIVDEANDLGGVESESIAELPAGDVALDTVETSEVAETVPEATVEQDQVIDETPREPQANDRVQFRREGQIRTGNYLGRDSLGRHVVEVNGKKEFATSISPAAAGDTSQVQLSTGTRQIKNPATRQQLESLVDEFSASVPGAPRPQIVTIEQVRNDPEFQYLRDKAASFGIQDQLEYIDGWVNDGRVYIVEGRSLESAKKNMIHEIVSHIGAQGVATEAELNKIADIIRRSNPGIEQKVRLMYEGADEATITNEMIAMFSEEYQSADPMNLPKGWKKAWEDIKRVLRAIIKRLGGNPNAWDDVELHQFFSRAIESLSQAPDTTDQGTQLSISQAYEVNKANFPGTPEAIAENERQLEAGVSNAREMQARFAPYDARNRQYIGVTFQEMQDDANSYLDTMSLDDSYQAIISNTVPDAFKPGADGRQNVLAAMWIRRAETMLESVTDPYDQARNLGMLNEMALRYAAQGTRDGRALGSRANANALLQPIAPILANQQIMIRRADNVTKRRFEGGVEAATRKVRRVDKIASEEAADELNSNLSGESTERKAIRKEATKLRNRAQESAERIFRSLVRPKQEGDPETDPVRELYNAHIANPFSKEDFVNALVDLTVDQQTAETLFTTSMDEIRGRQLEKILKDQAALVRAEEKRLENVNKQAEDLVNSSDQSLPSTKAKRQTLSSLFRLQITNPKSFIEFFNELTKIGVNVDLIDQLYKKAELERQFIQEKKDADEALKDLQSHALSANRIIGQLAERYSDTPTYRPGKGPDLVREIYQKHIKAPMTKDAFVGQLTDLNVPYLTASSLYDISLLEIKALARINELKLIDSELKKKDRAIQVAERRASQLIYRTEEKLRQGSKDLDSSESGDTINKAFREQVETPSDWPTFRDRLKTLNVGEEVANRLFRTAEREASDQQSMQDFKDEKSAREAREKLIGKDSKKLADILNRLRKKMYPDMNWRDIFEMLPDQQRERQAEIYTRLRLDERLQGLTQAEAIELTNELDKAWQRERRKVFQRELSRVGVLGEKSKADTEKVVKAIPALLRSMNLGTFNSAMFRDAVAAEYGIRLMSQEDAARLRKLAIEAWELPEGVIRNKKLRDILSDLQRTTGSSRVEILNNFWMASVLSGTATSFDTFMSALNGFGNNLLQASALVIRGRGKAGIEAHAQWWSGLRQGLQESLSILLKGDYTGLKRFGEDLNKSLEGESNFRPVPLGEELLRSGKWYQQGLATVMVYTGRIMAAADHINNTATTHGAMAVARALNPEIYNNLTSFTKEERANARTRAIEEVTGGIAPRTLEEKNTVSVRTREILHNLLSDEHYAEASFIGDQAAYQNDPIGLFGSVYSVFNTALGSAERAAESLSEDPNFSNSITRAGLAVLAGGLRGITGTKFMRFGFNFGNDLTQYIPGTVLAQKLAPVYGADMTRSQQDLLMAKNIFGLMVTSSLAAFFMGGDDDEDRPMIEGNWSSLSKEKKAQLRSAGREPMTITWRTADGTVKRLSYKSWPTGGIFVAVGGMLDQKRYEPAKWSQTGVGGHLLKGVTTGVLHVRDTAALEGLSELIGSSSYSSNADADFMDKLTKLPARFVGGFVPNLLKDVDTWDDPRHFRPESTWDEYARNVPVVRRSVAEGRQMLDLLGGDVKITRTPWRRVFTEAEKPGAYKELGDLLDRGMTLTPPNPKRKIRFKGQETTIEGLGKEAEWRYAKILGGEYKKFLEDNGTRLRLMTDSRADDFIKDRSRVLSERAEKLLIRDLTNNPPAQ